MSRHNLIKVVLYLNDIGFENIKINEITKKNKKKTGQMMSKQKTRNISSTNTVNPSR